MEAQPHRPMLFPYSPTTEEWAALTADEKWRYYDSVPADPDKEASPPEGLWHDTPILVSREAPRHFFHKKGRRIFVASDLRVLYPGEEAFAPDLMVVMDVEKPFDVDFRAWVVAEEHKGLDLVMEVYVAGDRRKDAVENVERYGRLGIPEYFFFDRPQSRLFGYRLTKPGAKSYRPIMPQGGRLHSEVLDLDLALVDGHLRFFSGTAELPTSDELIDRLDREMEAKDRQIEAEIRAREAAEQGREEAERRVAELLAENERLRKQFTGPLDGTGER